MADGRVKTRKTRFVCISDTHNAFPGGAFKLPKGDVLIHAGDLTNQGTFKELQQTLNWIEDSEFDAKIVIAGNNTPPSPLAPHLTPTNWNATDRSR